MRGPSGAVVRCVQPVRTGLAEACPENNGVGMSGVLRCELFDVDLFCADGTCAVTWLRVRISNAFIA